MLAQAARVNDAINPREGHRMDLRALLELLFVKKASDLHFRAGALPVLRINGDLFAARAEKVTAEEMETFLREMLSAPQYETLYRDRELDLALNVPGHGRTRVNVFFQRGMPALAIRAIKTKIPAFGELMLPPVMEKIAAFRRGIVLLTGATGSGKSTTLASMIEHINTHRSTNILTIEDPIEYIFSNKKSLIAQREVMIDTHSFHAALVHALREDPDVIMVGEIRDAGNDEDRAAGRRDRPPGADLAPHAERGRGDQPHHFVLSAERADADPLDSRRHRPGHRLAAARQPRRRRRAACRSSKCWSAPPPSASASAIPTR